MWQSCLTWRYAWIVDTIWELLVGAAIFLFLGYSCVHLFLFGGGQAGFKGLPFSPRASGCLSSAMLLIVLALMVVFWGPHLAAIAVRLLAPHH